MTLVILLCGKALFLTGFAQANARQPARAQRPGKRYSGKPIAQLIRDLGSPKYKMRQAATRELVARRRQAMSAIIKTAQGSDLESAARAVMILEQLYADVTLDEADVPRVTATLENLRAKGKPTVSQLAANALARNTDLRERRAIAMIKKLGGIVEYMTYEQSINRGIPIQPQTNNGRPRINFVLLGSKWKGGDDGLKYLRRVSDLPNLYIARNKAFSPVTQKALDKLIEAMPGMRVHERGLSCLGVSGYQNGGGQVGCYVSLVKSKSAAAKGGMRTGDYIVEFGGKKVTDFEALVKLIANHKPGTKVPVTVRRGGSTQKLTVVLQEWAP